GTPDRRFRSHVPLSAYTFGREPSSFMPTRQPLFVSSCRELKGFYPANGRDWPVDGRGRIVYIGGVQVEKLYASCGSCRAPGMATKHQARLPHHGPVTERPTTPRRTPWQP